MQIYGIDISKNHLDIHGIKEDGVIVSKRITNKLKAISKFLCSTPKDSLLCAEHTGVYGDLLVQLVNCSGLKIALIPGYTLKKSMGDRKGKSDKVDAERIHEYAMRFTDQLQLTKPKDIDMIELKELFNLRAQLVKQRRMLNTNKTNKQGAISSSVFGQKLLDKSILELKENISQIEKEMLLIISSNQQLNKTYQLITSVTGIGPIIAISLIMISENFTKLDTARKAAAFVGVCPYLNESGNKRTKARVHHRSDKKMKSLLYLAAKCICMYNKEFKLYKERKMNEGKHYFLVMNNVANKILRTIYAVLKSEEPYNPMYMALDPRLIKN